MPRKALLHAHFFLSLPPKATAPAERKFTPLWLRVRAKIPSQSLPGTNLVVVFRGFGPDCKVQASHTRVLTTFYKRTMRTRRSLWLRTMPAPTFVKQFARAKHRAGSQTGDSLRDLAWLNVWDEARSPGLLNVLLAAAPSSHISWYWAGVYLHLRTQLTPAS